ncbi:uncharacterized protein TNCV_737311 [Trichonephila clavipes]|nr:uncharacterized protein TNCV_737311 [Trichonephila clavipes]
MFDSGSFVNPTPLAHADTSRDILARGGTSQWCPTRFNLYDPEMRNARGFSVLPEVYFSGSENVTEFLEGTDNQIKLLEIPSDLSCTYLKGHLLGRALDWVREVVVMWKDEVGMSVGCLMLVIIEEIGEILKRCVDRVMVEMIIRVTTRIAVKEISGSRVGIGFKTMIEDLTIGDINLELSKRRF